jgi:hypothetical protein
MPNKARHLVNIKKPSWKVQTQYPLLVYKRISQEGATKVAFIFKNQKSSTVAGLLGVSENERFAKIINKIRN